VRHFHPSADGRGLNYFSALVVGALVVGVGSCGLFVRLAAQYNLHAMSDEARVNVAAVATAERTYFKEHGAFIAAGPAPAGPPCIQKRDLGRTKASGRSGGSPRATSASSTRCRSSGTTTPSSSPTAT